MRIINTKMTMVKTLILSLSIAMIVPAQANKETANIGTNSAQQAFQAKDYLKAKDLFKQQLQQDDKSVTSHLFLARISLKNEQLDNAQEHIVKAVELIEDHFSKKSNKELDKEIQAEVFHWFGTIMENQAEASSIFSASGYAKNSLKGYVKSVELLPNKLQYREALINFYLDAPSLLGGDIDKAITHAKIAFEQDTNFGYKMLVNSYAQDGATQLLLGTYRSAIEQFPLDAELLLMRGSYWKGEREYDKAVADYKRASALPATDNDQKSAQLYSWYWTGRISGFNGENLARGIAAYQQFLVLEKRFDQSLGEASIPSPEWAQFRMAKLMILNEQKKEAAAIFSKLLNSTQRENLKKAIRKEIS